MGEVTPVCGVAGGLAGGVRGRCSRVLALFSGLSGPICPAPGGRVMSSESPQPG
jgi:hypothetical protein